MKRGFLNSDKARAKLTTSIGGDAPAPEKRTVHVFKPSYGVVENPGLPEGYRPAELNIEEMNPHIDPSTLPEDGFLFTSLPIETSAAAESDGWTACMVRARIKARVLSTPGFPAPMPRPPAVRHRVGPAPGMGMGAFSITKLRVGDLILSERPLLIASAQIFGGADVLGRGFTEEQMKQAVIANTEKVLEAVFGRLDPEQKIAYMALANSHLQDGSGPLLGIMRTNGLGADSLTCLGNPPVPYTAVCKEISRLNHSCCPNTSAIFDIASFSFRLFAVRDIAPGEELTFPYFDITMPTAQRQKALEPYGFRCICRACRDPTSDARRATMRDIPKIHITPELMRMWAVEELQTHPDYAEHAKMLALRYTVIGDEESALVWGRLHAKLAPADGERLPDSASIRAHPWWARNIRGARP